MKVLNFKRLLLVKFLKFMHGSDIKCRHNCNYSSILPCLVEDDYPNDKSNRNQQNGESSFRFMKKVCVMKV